MAQYIEHPALLGMRMGNQASQQRMQGYQQAVDRNTVAQLQAAQLRDQRMYELMRERDALKSGQPVVRDGRVVVPAGTPPTNYGLDVEKYLVQQQAAAQNRNPQVAVGKPGWSTGPNVAPSTDIPFQPSVQLQQPGPVGPGFKSIRPDDWQQISQGAVPEPEPSWWDRTMINLGLKQQPQQNVRTATAEPMREYGTGR